MSLYTKLEPLKLYALRQNSLVDCELKTYETELLHAQKKLKELLAAAFVQTADAAGLLRHERLVGLGDRPEIDLETRRELVLYRRSVAPFDFNLNGLVNSILAVGMQAELIEDCAGEKLTVISRRLLDRFLDLDSVKQSLFTMLPAHLEIIFDVGHMAWDMLDAKDCAWDDLDGLGRTWEEFDLGAAE